MKKRPFKNTSESISLLGFGMMRLPRLDPQKMDIDYPAAEAMIDTAIKSGVNYFDTAWSYHMETSENFAGHALSRYPRQSYNLASKMPVWLLKSPGDAEKFFETQLKKCRVDYFDYYLVHNLNADNYAQTLKYDVHSFLRKKQEEGLIRHVGFSFHDTPALLERITAEKDWDFAQIQLNYIDWETIDSKRQYEILVEKGLPVIIMEPVRGGSLASLNETAINILKDHNPMSSPASWALRYAASLPGVLTVLSGMSAMEHVEDNIKTMRDFVPLSDEERAVLAQAADAYKRSATIPCTACRYCMDCPSGVDIPRVFGVYNHAQTVAPERTNIVFNSLYRALGADAQADNCIACGQCLEHCPQHIDIPEQMKMVDDFAIAARPR